MQTPVESVYDASRTRRVTIFRREDHSFGFIEEFYCDEPEYHCWLPRSFPASRFDSLDVARRETSGRVPWLSELSPGWQRSAVNE